MNYFFSFKFFNDNYKADELLILKIENGFTKRFILFSIVLEKGNLIYFD